MLLLKAIPIITLRLSINMFGTDTQQCSNNLFFLSRENRKKKKKKKKRERKVEKFSKNSAVKFSYFSQRWSFLQRNSIISF